MKKTFKIFVVLCSFFIFSYNAHATTLQDLYNELNNLEKSYEAAKKKSELTKSELNNIKAGIANAEAEIVRAQNEITKAEEEINKSENEIATKKEETNQMLLYLQLMNSNEDNLLEYIMDADNYTDFIYRYSVVTQMSDYNQKIIAELDTLINNLNDKKKELANKQKDLSKKKSELQSKYAIVQVQYKQENDEGLDIADEITEKRKIIKNYEKMGCKKNENINSCGNILAVDGWVYPLNSFYQTSNYGWDENRYHYAVDLGVEEGNSVKAVANGTVLSSRLTSVTKSCYSSVTRKSYTNCHCGGYVIQILHNYKGTNYVSLYMHLLTPYVQQGDRVTAGQVIATSGGGAQSVEKWHDHCTGGAHLHFTMSYGASLVGTSSTQGSTFNPIKFFPAMKGIGSRYGN